MDNVIIISITNLIPMSAMTQAHCIGVRTIKVTENCLETVNILGFEQLKKVFFLPKFSLNNSKCRTSSSNSSSSLNEA